MRNLRGILAAAALVLSAAACGGEPGGLLGPAAALFNHGDTLTVAISAPDSVTVGGTVVATGSLIQGSGSWWYTWYFRRCTGSGCSPGWTQTRTGQNVLADTQTINSTDWWVEWKVELADVYGHVLKTDTHHTGAPRAQAVTPTVEITGSTNVTDPGDEEYLATVYNGTGTWTYTWEQNVDGQGWEFVGTDNPIQYCISPLDGATGAHSYTLGVRVSATNGTTTISDTEWVSVALPTRFHYPCSGTGS
ncbi:MAG TPA: hypothetical protein VF142_13850 [Longimicrobium sp.]